MPTPILTVAQMREWEKSTWATGQTEAAVISQVGKLVAERACLMTHPGDLIGILGGKGNNGEDVRHSQSHLSERKVQAIHVTDPKTAPADLESLLDRRPALLIDGLFGIGLNRPLNSDWARLIEQVNRAQRPVLAVDLPSGLNAETGEPQGAAIEAAVTLTLGAPKTGLLKPSAYPYVGRLEVAPEIGLIPCPIATETNWTLPTDFETVPPRRPVHGHKGTFGHVALFAGSLGYHGASVLAARGALQARPGLVTLFTQENVYLPVAAQLQAAMVHPWPASRALPDTATGILVGPGLAQREWPSEFIDETKRLWLNSPLPMVVDASALAWLPEGAVSTDAVRVVTPHPGEAARMLGSSSAAVQSDRGEAVRELSRRRGDCWVVLKGHQTVIGRSQGNLSVNSSGNPELAQGGSGDVLAGFLAGLLAQPKLQEDPATTIRYAIWHHGMAADVLSDQGMHWTVDDLAAVIGERVE